MGSFPQGSWLNIKIQYLKPPPSCLGDSTIERSFSVSPCLSHVDFMQRDSRDYDSRMLPRVSSLKNYPNIVNRLDAIGKIGKASSSLEHAHFASFCHSGHAYHTAFPGARLLVNLVAQLL